MLLLSCANVKWYLVTKALCLLRLWMKETFCEQVAANRQGLVFEGRRKSDEGM
jgi:hypothetical protein